VPFTPFHLGPALGLGLPLRRYVHAPTFLVANVIVDVEPFLVLFFGLGYPLHGYLHTFFLAFFLGVVLGCVTFLLERFLRPLYGLFLLEPGDRLGLRSFVFAGAFGTVLHVLLDSPLYGDISPFFPLTVNPMYHPAVTLKVYGLCVLMGVLGIAYYVGLLAFSVYRRARGR